MGELTPLARLLFIGLWTLADRSGRLEERLGTIRIQVFPFDNLEPMGFSMLALIEELARPRKHSPGAFITRYTVDGARYIQINGFTKHQKCHPNEPKSELPSCPQLQPTSTNGISPSTIGIRAQAESKSNTESNTESDSTHVTGVGSVPDEQRSEYADAVWQEFIRVSGQRPTRVMGPGEWTTLKAWMDLGVPVAIVCRGMADAGGRGSTLAYYQKPVEKAIATWKRGL